MEEVSIWQHLVSLLMLVMLQAVLGFDNLLYISLESKNAPEEQQSMVRKLGIGGAVVLRIVLLVILVNLIKVFQDPFLDFQSEYFGTTMNIHSVIVLGGGIFILYTAIKEIFHMFSLEVADEQESQKKSAGAVIFWIIIMNLVFSFDSILSAMALTDNIYVMATAIIIGGILMIWLAGTVSEFLRKNRLYEVLGLFVLLVVGIMLLTEGGHLAHLTFWGNEITPMSKTTFYFVIVIMVLIDIVQGRYQKKLEIERQKRMEDKN